MALLKQDEKNPLCAGLVTRIQTGKRDGYLGKKQALAVLLGLVVLIFIRRLLPRLWLVRRCLLRLAWLLAGVGRTWLVGLCHSDDSLGLW